MASGQLGVVCSQLRCLCPFAERWPSISGPGSGGLDPLPGGGLGRSEEPVASSRLHRLLWRLQGGDGRGQDGSAIPPEHRRILFKGQLG